jgi:hypothetical protein
LIGEAKKIKKPRWAAGLDDVTILRERPVEGPVLHNHSSIFGGFNDRTQLQIAACSLA